MAKRSQTGAAGTPAASATFGVGGVRSDMRSGGTPPDVDWHGEAASIATRHWRRTLRLVAVLMAIGFVVTFVPQFWAREWAAMRFAGWPLPFYMGAQGAILIDIVLIMIYVAMQRRNDTQYRRALSALRDAHRDSLGMRDAGAEFGAMPDPLSRATSARAPR
ncbi:DUF4212 domain-containing protein [Pandoraea pnomenusa]|jgi:putative solute:sodium symporter small subunit|uniref:Predicted membrane protein n=1 Tax=Pandoraea pnomenusa TaxID=93220 RepID=A0A378YTB7_9BURK|nr:DUF4212 domain-containing protein [Pandoraea pnomenusa]SUA80402.1 Predicted membrane protein [Pandoraea pnomenusa]